MRVDWLGERELARALQRKSQADFEQVGIKSLLELRNRAVQTRNPEQGGTPVDSAELRQSVSVNGDTMGYIKDYAPHVEYGHRTRNGGFVPGQYFLKQNTETQRPIYKQDLKNKLSE